MKNIHSTSVQFFQVAIQLLIFSVFIKLQQLDYTYNVLWVKCNETALHLFPKYLLLTFDDGASFQGK